MSDPILPLAVWEEGTLQNDIPANDNALRVEALSRNVLAVANSPAVTTDGTVYIVGNSPSGAFSTFSAGDITIRRDGNWYAWAPVSGVVVNLAGELKEWSGSAWVDIGGSGSDRTSVNALSISSGVVNIDCSLGDFFTLSLTANVTSITFSNLPVSGKAAALAIRLRQDGTGGRTVALPSSFKAISGSDTSVQSSANSYTVLHLETFDQGTRWEYSMRAGSA